jgi:hypothetical protein
MFEVCRAMRFSRSTASRRLGGAKVSAERVKQAVNGSKGVKRISPRAVRSQDREVTRWQLFLQTANLVVGLARIVITVAADGWDKLI